MVILSVWVLTYIKVKQELFIISVCIFIVLLGQEENNVTNQE